MNFEDAKQQASKVFEIWAITGWFYHFFEIESKIFDALYAEHNEFDSLSCFFDLANSLSIPHKQKWCKFVKTLSNNYKQQATSTGWIMERLNSMDF